MQIILDLIFYALINMFLSKKEKQQEYNNNKVSEDMGAFIVLGEEFGETKFQQKIHKYNEEQALEDAEAIREYWGVEYSEEHNSDF